MEHSIYSDTNDALSVTGVAVEKVRFSKNSQILGDRKCLPEPRKSFVRLPNAKFFGLFLVIEFFNS